MGSKPHKAEGSSTQEPDMHTTPWLSRSCKEIETARKSGLDAPVASILHDRHPRRCHPHLGGARLKSLGHSSENRTGFHCVGLSPGPKHKQGSAVELTRFGNSSFGANGDRAGNTASYCCPDRSKRAAAALSHAYSSYLLEAHVVRALAWTLI